MNIFERYNEHLFAERFNSARIIAKRFFRRINVIRKRANTNRICN